MATTTTTRTDLYESITQRVIEGLQQRGLSWFRPWGGADDAPMNWATKTRYRGVNVFLLNAAMTDFGFTANEWMTFKQASEAGGKVAKGSKSTCVIYWVVSYCHTETGKWYSEAELKKAGIKKSECDERWTLRSYNVFNVAQVEGLDPRRVAPTSDEFTPATGWEWVWEGYANRPTLNHGGNKAYYRPSADLIQMPEATTFVAGEAYAHTLFHEMIHSTGHTTRLKRAGVVDVQGFGTDSYAQEELVAEIGAEYLSALAGVEWRADQSQAYINGWVKQLKDHPRMVVYAAQQASAAVEHILGN